MAHLNINCIVNPHAGHGSTGSKWPMIKALVKDRIGSFTSHITTRAGDARQFARKAIASGATLIICVGGDGTLNEVVNGIMTHNEPERSDVLLGFVPNGTGCDFIRTVQIPGDIEKAIDLIAKRPVRKIDTGRITFSRSKGQEGYYYFHNIASFGLGGEVAQRVNRTTKAFGPFLSFMWATLMSLFLYGKKKVRVVVDGEFDQENHVWNIAVANGQYHGGGMRVAPNASIDDGLLNVTIIGDLTLPEVFMNLPKLYSGKIGEIDKVITLTGKQVEALSDQHVLLEVDGEQPGILPIVVDVVPGALNIITPES
ncbi:MAG: diacylglycerol kinase family lipid kinase [Desulfobacterales bacterium]|nr:MAG: diacylglycerol kinase family lipid kinase [Desulfobacterales bacterium]